MFKLNNKIGDHKIFSYDLIKHPFVNFFKKLFNNDNLSELHKKSSDYNQVKDYLELGHLNDRDTDLHKIFYEKIKSDLEFKLLYCKFIKDIHQHFYPDQECILYQSFPSVRFQYPESVTIPPHKDSDNLSNHPLNEKNFLLPITDMINTNSIYIESEPDKKDFQSIKLNSGELFYFNGNRCTHYNEKNKENKLRISLDFRIMLLKDYNKYIEKNEIIYSNPRDIFWNRPPKLMLAGGYYQITFKKDKLDKMIEWTDAKTILQHRPTFGNEEANACYEYMLEDTFVTEYKKTEELQNMIRKFLNIKYCLMTPSGTTAIILALMSLDLKPGDEVIVPNYTMIATVNSIKFLNLKPVIVDVDKETFTLNLDEIKKNVSEKTKCVLHVSLNNRYKNIEEIVNYCKLNNLFLLEDSAQSLGCKINGKNLGTFGNIGCFSLSSPKIISTGQGGFVVTDNEELYNKMRMMKNFGREKSGVDNFILFGINLKFTDIQAVIGIEQMKKLDFRVKRMKEIYNLYYERLSKYYEMRKPLSNEWIPWFVDIFTDKRNEIINYLNKHKIKTRPVYGEINKTPVYLNENTTTLVNSNYVSTKGLFLPSYITLTNKEINYICDILISFYYFLIL